MKYEGSGPGLRKVVSVNTTDLGGGAERMARLLSRAFRERGLDSWLLVGERKTDDPRVMPFFLSPHMDYRPYGGQWHNLWVAWRKRVEGYLGVDDFHFPYSRHLTRITGSRPDVVHCHNLHGGYFDLRVLAAISKDLPVFLTIQDCWTWTGHCAYPIGCGRWKSGCGKCPQLMASGEARRDATRFNLLRKRGIYKRSRLRVAAPSRWVLEQAEQSVLAPAIIEARVIPNAVDFDVFKPAAERSAIRDRLSIPQEAFVMVLCAHRLVSNPFKDYATVRAAAVEAARRAPNCEILLLAIGESAPDDQLGNLTVKHVPYQSPESLAGLFQVADVCVHAAKAETFGMVIAESMACGLPIIATDAGGVREVFDDGRHGILVRPSDPGAMAQAMLVMLRDPSLCRRLGRNARQHASHRFDYRHIADLYLQWFREAVATHRRAPRVRYLPGRVAPA